MKTTFLMLLILILLVGCTTDETNEFVKANATITLDNSSTREASGPNGDQFQCHHVYFDPAIYSPESIQEIRNGFFGDGSYWFAAPIQPEGFPYHQIWCRYLGHPGGSESENDPPTGVTFVPIGGHGG